MLPPTSFDRPFSPRFETIVAAESLKRLSNLGQGVANMLNTVQRLEARVVESTATKSLAVVSVPQNNAPRSDFSQSRSQIRIRVPLQRRSETSTIAATSVKLTW